MKKEKKEEEYNWKNRALSWSAISSFEWDKEQWYKKYVLNIQPDTSAPMEFGKVIGKKLELDPDFLPQIERHSKMEHEFSCKFGNIKLIGFADSFCDKTCKKLAEFKTGKKAWDQKRANEHGQIDMYLLMNYLMNKIKPEEVTVDLVWMPTQDNGDFSISFVEPIADNIKVFRTTRTMQDILRFAERIKRTYQEMEEYAERRKNWD